MFWSNILLGYDYEIIYKPSHENSVADALSSETGSQSLDSLYVSQTSLWDAIEVASITQASSFDPGHKISKRESRGTLLVG